MDSIVAIIVRDEEGLEHGLLTWGRTFGSVAYDQLLEAVRPWLSKFGIRVIGEAGMRPAKTLQEVVAAPHFHECLFDMHEQHLAALLRDPSLIESDAWFARCRERVEQGRDIWYIGLRSVH